MDFVKEVTKPYTPPLPNCQVQIAPIACIYSGAQTIYSYQQVATHPLDPAYSLELLWHTLQDRAITVQQLTPTIFAGAISRMFPALPGTLPFTTMAPRSASTFSTCSRRDNSPVSNMAGVYTL
eukprot:GHUV01044739.1.p1 GENE.GHUV01044739.1~~GHUV01044739.1.p1  ORF type:complete len:123 (+),score=12.87 GHUV01044739.1:296-664(+)